MDAITQEELAVRLLEARDRAGLTQQQVAESLEIPRTAVSQIENGNRQISSLELLRMASLYGVELRDLIDGKDSSAEILTFFRRKPGSVQPELELMVKEILPICRMAADIEELIERDAQTKRGPYTIRYNPSVLAGNHFRQGLTVARAERERLGLGAAPITDLSILAKNYGLIVAEHLLPTDISGIFLNLGNERCFILTNREETHGRRRFSLAHEIGHALIDLHEKVIVSREGDDNALETRANAFAAAFLLPREAVIEYLTKRNLTKERIDFTHVTELLVRYGMSYEAVLVSLERFNIIDRKKRDELAGHRKQWPGYAFEQLSFREPQYNRITLQEWTFHRMILAFERGVITRRKAISVGKKLGYHKDAITSSMELVENGFDG